MLSDLYSAMAHCSIILCLLVIMVQLSFAQKLPKGCGDPGVPKHGSRVGDSFSIKSSVEYFCDKGFKLAKGSRLRQCQESGKWSGVLPKCTGKRKNNLYACGTIISNNTARNRRIVGGREAKHGAWPWQAAIFYKNYIGRKVLFNGAFIKSRWVVTVASHLNRNGKHVKPQRLQVVLGEHNREKLDGTERYMRVKRIIIHPKYDRDTLTNNIALLELAKPVKPTSHIRTVCLPRRKRDGRLEKPPYSGFVAGWGSRKKIRLGENTGLMSPTLQQVGAPLVHDKICSRSSIYPYDKASYLCAGYRKRAKAPCFRDVGSPLVVQSPKTGRWVVLGLFAWSEGCAQPKKYAYYTRMTRYRRWILSVIHSGH